MPTRAWLSLLLALSPSLALAQELVPNGGFEDGATGWNGGRVVATSPHAGAACLEIDDASATQSVAAQSGKLPVVAGKAYRFSVWVRAAVEGQIALVTLNQFRADGSWISGNNLDFTVGAGSAWSEFAVTLRRFHVEATQVAISLRPVAWTDGGELTGKAWFDDASFAQATGVTDPIWGRWLAHPSASVRLWVPATEQKVQPDDRLDDSAPTVAAIAFEAARGEVEPAQVALLPASSGVVSSAVFSALSGPGGASIPASALDLREVAYVPVTTPTDFASRTGLTPDPLPPFAPGLAFAAGKQTPLWITLRVPTNAAPGTYRGSLTLELSPGGTLQLPLEATVWDFTLPRERHHRTAYGLSLGEIDRYHNLGGDPAARREALRLYLRDFAEHRVSPQDPFGDDRYVLQFPNLNWPLERIVQDPAAPTNRVLEVIDASTTAAVGVSSESAIPVTQGHGYTLTFRARTDTAHDYLVTVRQFDAAGAWIPGKNQDFVQAGTTSWQAGSATVAAAKLAPETASVRVTLWARRWTEGGELTGTTWFDDVSFKDAAGGPELLKNGDFQTEAKDAEPAFDFTRFDPAAAFALDELGMDSFAVHLPSFAWGTFEQRGTPTLLGLAWGTPEYEALYVKVLAALEAHLEKKSWLTKGYAYWFDEPEPKDYAFVKQGMALLRRGAPGIARLLTEQGEPELLGSVDVWSPLLDLYSEPFARERQAKGEQVFWYVCTGPRAPYPNDFIDHPGLEHRLRFWMAFAYGVQGDLYWQTNYWTNDEVFPPPARQDPWTDPMSHHFQGGKPGIWGNGDGRLLYPPRGWKDGKKRVEAPVPSLRWELIREGLEDFEYLWLLRDGADRLAARGGHASLVAEARALLALQSLFRSTRDYTQEPDALRAHRHAVAEKLVEELRALNDEPQADAGMPPDALTEADAQLGTDASAMADAAEPADAWLSDAGGRDLAPAPTGCGCGGSGPTALWVLGLLALGRLRRGRSLGDESSRRQRDSSVQGRIAPRHQLVRCLGRRHFATNQGVLMLRCLSATACLAALAGSLVACDGEKTQTLADTGTASQADAGSSGPSACTGTCTCGTSDDCACAAGASCTLNCAMGQTDPKCNIACSGTSKCTVDGQENLKLACSNTSECSGASLEGADLACSNSAKCDLKVRAGAKVVCSNEANCKVGVGLSSTVTCSNTATCAITGTMNDEYTVLCTDSAKCHCKDNCSLTCGSTGLPTTCGDGSKVCNQACP